MARELGSLGRTSGFLSVTKREQLSRYGVNGVKCNDPQCQHPEIGLGQLVFIRVRSGRPRLYYCIHCAVAGGHVSVEELREVLTRTGFVKCESQPCLDLLYTIVIDDAAALGLVVA